MTSGAGTEYGQLTSGVGPTSLARPLRSRAGSQTLPCCRVLGDQVSACRAGPGSVSLACWCDAAGGKPRGLGLDPCQQGGQDCPLCGVNSRCRLCARNVQHLAGLEIQPGRLLSLWGTRAWCGLVALLLGLVKEPELCSSSSHPTPSPPGSPTSVSPLPWTVSLEGETLAPHRGKPCSVSV